MCRTLSDAAILLSVLAGVDAEDRATLDGRGRIFPDYTKFLEPLRTAESAARRESSRAFAMCPTDASTPA
jgi:Asp-tRNA(Asn)/Glu-tRNA(Gln) amidotransferase A subunit family amidase